MTTLPDATSFTFDIGHSSIGWAALQEPSSPGGAPQLLGCGSVVFPPDDCQNQQRAAFRRQRRHIASTRNRIKRLSKLLAHIGALTPEQLSARHTQGGGHSFPWLLAARVLVSDKTLNWEELWDVLRWYAHNRGYDGNALWSGQTQGDDTDEDAQKVENARKLMEEYGTETMAETVCAFLGLDPRIHKNRAPTLYFKGNNAAFPRQITVDEVRRILEAHKGKLPGLDEAFIDALICDWKVARDSLGVTIRLPGRYRGGLLFGQMVPRFDNRIIPHCRISGKKTPDRHCSAFYRYRWGMLMVNMRKLDPLTERPVPLSAEDRQKLHIVMEQEGYMTKSSLGKALRDVVGVEPTNLDTLFLTSEMEKALIFDPLKRELNSSPLKEVWPHIPEKWQKVFAGQLYKGRKINGRSPALRDWRERLAADGVELSGFDTALDEALNKAIKAHRSKKKAPPTLTTLLNMELRLHHQASGRSPYARDLMEKAWEQITDGLDPKARFEDGSYGCLAETPEVVARQLEVDIDQQTNNHLVRHRLHIFRKLLADMTARYAGGNPEAISQIAIEVVRDLQEFSGKTAKEKAQLLGIKLSDHRAASAWLETQRKELGLNFAITAGLIKKVRIARDMGWTCPFIGKKYSLQDILEDRVDREHIIPRSLRPSDSLESLVLTFKHINQWKGKRTALRFIEETTDDTRTLSPDKYQKFVDSLPSKGGSDDDQKRRRLRKQFLLMRDYNKREGDFTGRDLTQTSHLNKLAAREALSYFASLRPNADELPLKPHQIVHMAGSVTSAVKRAWRIGGTLAQANPQILDESGQPRPKGEIRDVTHLHHALDAATLALSAWYFPKDGRLWTLMSRRRLNETEKAELQSLSRLPMTFGSDGKFDLQDLLAPLKAQLVARLAEKRVVMHQPRTMRGLKVQQNTWRVLGPDENDPEKYTITQAMRDSSTRKRKRKFGSEKVRKLHGTHPVNGSGKLSHLKGALIIETNYGVCLDPQPEVIPHFQVWQKLQEIRNANGGDTPRILRNGDVIQLSKGKFHELSPRWRIRSVKEDSSKGILVDMTFPDLVKVESKGYGIRRDVRLRTLLKDGLCILGTDYTGTVAQSES